MLTVRKVDVETGEVVGQSIRQFEGPLKDVPQALVALVAADLGAEPSVPVATAPGPAKRAMDTESGTRVRVRFRADSGATATWIWLEDGKAKTKLGEVPLDTVLEIRDRVFLSASEPGIGNRAWRYWLVGPDDAGDTAWKQIRSRFEIQAASPDAAGSRSSMVGAATSAGVPDWGLYSQERRDSDARRGRGLLLKGIGWTTFATGAVVGLVSLAMASDTNSRGEYTRSLESRQSLGRTAAVSFVGSMVGVVLAIVGSNILSEEDKRHTADLRIESLEGVGVEGDARGARISFAF